MPPVDSTAPPPTEPPPRRRRRRWWSLSVRGLMLLVLIVGGLVGWEANRVDRMRRAVAILERKSVVKQEDLGALGIAGIAIQDQSGVSVTYADRFRNGVEPNAPGPNKVVGWFRRSVGEDHFRRVRSLDFARRPTPEDWDAIRALGSVEGLTVMNNRLVDADLARLAECSSLRDIDFSFTPITDATLVAVGRLPDLRSLDIDQTHTSNEGLAFLANQRGLEVLTLRSDIDADPALDHLRNGKNLRSLKVGRMSDRGAEAIRGQTQLEHLSFAAWNLSDKGWGIVTGFRHLKTLRVSPGEVGLFRSIFGRATADRPLTLTPGGMRSIRQLTNLEDLNLDRLGTDDWLEAVGPLTRLRKLSVNYLHRDEISDAGLISVGRLVNLEELAIDCDRASDAGMKAIEPLARLRSLTLYGDSIGDAGFISIGRLTGLERLSISCPKVTDLGLKHLTPLTRLASLTVFDAQVSAEGIADLRAALPTLRHVYNMAKPAPTAPTAPQP